MSTSIWYNITNEVHTNESSIQKINKKADQNQDKTKITEFDLNIIKYGDIYSADHVVYKIKKIYEVQGKEALSPVIPIIVDKVITMSKGVKSEIEFEVLKGYIWILNVTADERALPALFAMLSCEGVYYGTNFPQALLNLGNSVIPVLIDSLDSSSKITRWHTALTLRRMKKLDSSGKFFSEKDIDVIRNKLITIVTDTKINDKLIAISALGEFGNEATLLILYNIKNNDQYKVKNVKGKDDFLNRDSAEETIIQLEKKLKKNE
jgi:hypothetical protein